MKKNGGCLGEELPQIAATPSALGEVNNASLIVLENDLTPAEGRPFRRADNGHTIATPLKHHGDVPNSVRCLADDV
jgi:hypothetical protein